MSVASFPWSELWIDGKDTGQRTPVVHYPVSCGAHKLTLKRRDLKLERIQQVTVAPGHELKQHYELSDEYGDNYGAHARALAPRRSRPRRSPRLIDRLRSIARLHSRSQAISVTRGRARCFSSGAARRAWAFRRVGCRSKLKMQPTRRKKHVSGAEARARREGRSARVRGGDRSGRSGRSM